MCVRISGGAHRSRRSHLMLHNIGRHHWRKPAGINLNVFWTAQPGALRLARNARNLHLRLLTPSPPPHHHNPCLRYPTISCPSSHPRSRNLVNIHRYYVRGNPRIPQFIFSCVDPRESWFYRSIHRPLDPDANEILRISRGVESYIAWHDKITLYRTRICIFVTYVREITKQKL